jgi:LacI family transcriptional regulator
MKQITPIQKQKISTMKDVASMASVSLMTVSRVLNNDPNVTKKTRDRVMVAVEALNYRVNFSARSLSSSQSFVIAVFYDNSVGSFISEYIIGTLKRCNELGYHLIIEHCDFNEPDVEALISNVINRYTLDGVIIAPPLGDHMALLNVLETHNLRYVRVGPGFDLHRAAYVAIDDYRATFTMTELLIRYGHKKIGFIKGDVHQGVSNMRLRGFVDAMREHALDVGEGYIAEGNFDFASGLIAAEQLLSQAGITAIFASNDDMAAAVIAVAHRKNLNVPSQLSVAGFDDTHIATNIWPQLTTVQQPIKNMAIEAVNLLVDMIQTESKLDIKLKNSRILEHTIVERNSVAACVKK